MAKAKGTLAAPGSGGTQPPPPPVGGGGSTWTPRERKKGEAELVEAMYYQLIEVRRVVEALAQEAKDARLRRKLELVPVRTGDLMRGFQAAVARANLATRAGSEAGGEVIEELAIKNLEVSVTAPVIDAGHAEDPILMLPNLKNPDPQTAQVSLKFTVVSVPAKSSR